MRVGKKPEMGKWLLYQFFYRNKDIRPYLPETRKYSHAAFRDMLNRYRSLYVKPVAGSQGKGIIKVWRSANGRYSVKKTTLAANTFTRVDEVIRRIDALRGGKMYIVQRGIDLAKVHGRPMDIRVMMQREKPGGRWLYSGMLAKVAGPGSVVTNTALSRGTVMDVPPALTKALGWSRERADRVAKRLESLGFVWARHFDTYQLYRELGFDVAVDTSGRIWLLEQNTAPSHALFKRNKANLAAYRRIQYRWGAFERARRNQAREKGKAKGRVKSKGTTVPRL